MNSIKNFTFSILNPFNLNYLIEIKILMNSYKQIEIIAQIQYKSSVLLKLWVNFSSFSTSGCSLAFTLIQRRRVTFLVTPLYEKKRVCIACPCLWKRKKKIYILFCVHKESNKIKYANTDHLNIKMHLKYTWSFIQWIKSAQRMDESK